MTTKERRELESKVDDKLTEFADAAARFHAEGYGDGVPPRLHMATKIVIPEGRARMSWEVACDTLLDQRLRARGLTDFQVKAHVGLDDGELALTFVDDAPPAPKSADDAPALTERVFENHAAKVTVLHDENGGWVQWADSKDQEALNMLAPQVRDYLESEGITVVKTCVPTSDQRVFERALEFGFVPIEVVLELRL